MTEPLFYVSEPCRNPIRPMFAPYLDTEDIRRNCGVGTERICGASMNRNKSVE